MNCLIALIELRRSSEPWASLRTNVARWVVTQNRFLRSEVPVPPPAQVPDQACWDDHPGRGHTADQNRRFSRIPPMYEVLAMAPASGLRIWKSGVRVIHGVSWTL